jgi:predicted N-acetyltransferase YhbS
MSPIIRHLQASETAVRDSLLQEALRPAEPRFDIGAEYPIVLGQNGLSHSLGCFMNDRLVAHASVVPRTLIRFGAVQPQSIVLVGNVATLPEFRGQGLMRSLLEKAIAISETHKSVGVVLWSDLDSFYDKLGFRPMGREIRRMIAPEQSRSLSDKLAPPSDPEFVPIQQITDTLCRQLLQLRPTLPLTVDRSVDSFKELLTIPDTVLMITRGADKSPNAFYVLGKGYDLIGVLHEWGAKSPNHLASLIKWSQIKFQLPELMILMPQALRDSWASHPALAGQDSECHMALWHPNHVSSLDQNDVENFFIWGLDSI